MFSRYLGLSFNTMRAFSLNNAALRKAPVAPVSGGPAGTPFPNRAWPLLGYSSITKLARTTQPQSVAGGVIRREMTTSGHSKALKTKKAASKRFIRTGKGGLKRGRANKGHLTSKKSPDRKRRLNVKTQLAGATLKKMSSLLLSGK